MSNIEEMVGAPGYAQMLLVFISIQTGQFVKGKFTFAN